MDPLTHGFVGAALGHAGFGRQLGRQAAVIGAVVAMCPDLDLVYGAIAGPFDRLVSHRGVTHSLLFGPIVGTMLGWSYWRWRSRPPDDSIGRAGPWPWIGLFVFALLSHPLLDLFTSFGTQLLAPFSRSRFALHSIPIVDPAYSLILVAGVFGAALVGYRRGDHPGRPRISAWFTGVALALSTAYLFLGLAINELAESEARQQLEVKGVSNAEVHSFPTMLQLPHRRLVMLTDSEVRVGFISMWHPCPIQWGSARRVTNAYTRELSATDEGQIYRWFSGNLLAARMMNENQQQVVDLMDLRYGFERDPLLGMWGIRGYFKPGGRLLKPPERLIERPEVTTAAIRQLFADAFPNSCGNAT